ncbi:hypothetical protein VFPFJ_01693 [Purpureocillium lilacinum]|uniref:Uncharacterized protein n=1 Tax=Purpureocillium lilacinum TaxID=33203 RepID=A0A179I1X6_PURLI|nr:hypothetical protein VFPFJ_01693 [Purpureocillium lilacinum]OAQ95583.1 hypothetical protein VFPFJ_01693 [Purpureocillium lilacinum]
MARNGYDITSNHVPGASDNCMHPRFQTKIEAEEYGARLNAVIEEGVCSHDSQTCMLQNYQVYEYRRTKTPSWTVRLKTRRLRCEASFPCPNTASGFGFCKKGLRYADCYENSRF